MKRRAIQWMAVAGLCLFVISITGTADAGRFQRHMGVGGGHDGGRLFQELNLSDEQKSEIQGVRLKYQEERTAIASRGQAARKEMRAVLSADTVMEFDIRGAHRKWFSVTEDMAVLRANMMSEIKAVLTPEQREQLKVRIDQFSERRKEGRKYRQSF